jgi:hypothetical protein
MEPTSHTSSAGTYFDTFVTGYVLPSLVGAIIPRLIGLLVFALSVV